MTIPFKPSHIYIDEAVQDLPLTQKILALFPQVPREVIANPKRLKKTQDMTWAKKGLLLTRYKADWPLKPFQAVEKSCGRPMYSLNLISNCHLECTYCILQTYLSNNPLITIYTNLKEILEKVALQLKKIPSNSVIGTGKIADSLALEPITGLNQILIPFFAKQNHGTLFELKTKSDCVENLLNLEHNQKTVVSWSMNPQEIVEREEFKTASVKKRIEAASRCAKAGYKIGFHLDPMIHHENWKRNYGELIKQIFEAIAPEKIAWISLGTLRFPERQIKIMKNRFPKNSHILEGLQHTHLPFLTYPEDHRKEMYQTIDVFVANQAPQIIPYRCMEARPPKSLDL